MHEERTGLSRREMFSGSAKLAGGAALALALHAATRGNGATESVAAQTAVRSNPDAQMQTVLDAYAAFNAPMLTTLTPFQARNAPSFADAVMVVASQQGLPTVEPVGKIQHTLIPTSAGGLLARIYTPMGSGPFPVLVYFHGGGWVIANLDTYDASCRALTNAANCIVVSVAYRQGPEERFPAAVNDAVASTQWVMGNAAQFNGDPERVAVGGESAGGNLATVVTLALRDANYKLPVHQLLVYPVADFVDTNTASFQANQMSAPLSSPAVMWFGMYYLNNMQTEPMNQFVSPLRAQSLRGLPPATVITAEIDPLRDGGRQYAQRLQQEGVRVSTADYTGVTHEFFGASGVIDKAKQAVQFAAQGLRSSFGG